MPATLSVRLILINDRPSTAHIFAAHLRRKMIFCASRMNRSMPRDKMITTYGGGEKRLRTACFPQWIIMINLLTLIIIKRAIF